MGYNFNKETFPLSQSLGEEPQTPDKSRRQSGERANQRQIILSEEKRKQHHRKMHDRAKELRQRQTSAEEKLWALLRNKQLGGYKFRRQHPIGPFIVDFYCDEARLVIELDGGIHDGQMGYDEAWGQWLEENGYRVLRFGNKIIEEGEGRMAKEILRVCEKK
jgi:very-short-patch-repair endonuclease